MSAAHPRHRRFGSYCLDTQTRELRSADLCTGVAIAHPGDDDWALDAPEEMAASGRGSISIGFQGAHPQGLVTGTGVRFSEASETDVRSMTLGIEYWLGDHWSVNASLPFISKRALRDLGLHNQRRLSVPHPESGFIDDGQYHSAWQDWQLGLTHHASLGAFEIATHVLVTYPSHDYIFFASAPVGQGLKKVRVGTDVSQRIGRSNLHYSVGYSYEFECHRGSRLHVALRRALGGIGVGSHHGLGTREPGHALCVRTQAAAQLLKHYQSRRKVAQPDRPCPTAARGSPRR